MAHLSLPFLPHLIFTNNHMEPSKRHAGPSLAVRISRLRHQHPALKDSVRRCAVPLIAVVFLLVNYYYNKHVQSRGYPQLGYPLSEHTVDEFHRAVSSKQADRADTPFNAATASIIETISTLPPKVQSIYGPLEFQPTDLFEPFNANSLLFVSGMFVVYISCLVL